MRSKKTLANILSSLVLQLITIICGFIVPILIIGQYGSSVNGLVLSITQFLGYIVLLEAGVGGVIRSALYEPLAKKNIELVGSTLKAAEKFFRIIGCVFLGYLIIVAVTMPFLVNNEFEKLFTVSLILIIGISIFIEYFFGITYRLLLQADQRLYIVSIIQMFITIINTIAIVYLVHIEASIHFVKLCSVFIFVLRPVILYIYVKKKYKIVKNSHSNDISIEQKWDGMGHHLAYFLNSNTDIVVLTIFANIKEVSVYSVYMLVVTGVRNITTTFSSGIEAAFGNMLAKGEKQTLEKNFTIFEFFSFLLVTILFTSTALLITPFISVYTFGITDANYIRPVFAILFVASGAAYCIRLPYHSIVMAAGHFKQTRNGAFVEAGINITLSILLVNFYGIVGVAIGTLSSMTFRSLQYIHYLSKNILFRSVWLSLRKIAVNISAVLISALIVSRLSSSSFDNYVTWVLYACEVVSIVFVITIAINFLFYKKDFINFIGVVKKVSKKKNDFRS